VRVNSSQFSGSAKGAQPNSIDVSYKLDVTSDNGDKSLQDVTFTVVDENGAKICGEG